MQLEFSIPDIVELKRQHQETIKTILELLPDLNWNSRLEVKNYFSEEHWLALPDVKISTLREAREKVDPNSACYSDLTGLIEYYTLSYTIKNYLDCILRHHIDGTVTLREVNGEWRMPNKQSIPLDPQITECIVNQTIKVTDRA